MTWPQAAGLANTISLPSFHIEPLDLRGEGALDRLPLEFQGRGDQRGAHGPGLDDEPNFTWRGIFRKLGHRPADFSERKGAKPIRLQYLA